MKGLPPRRSDVARWRKRSDRLKKAEELLRLARWDINSELQACGPEEVLTNPMLLSKKRLIERIQNFLFKENK